MKQQLFLSVIACSLSNFCSGALIISQYVETDSGSTPKGIELFNTGSSTIDFSSTALTVLKGTNGAALSTDFTLSSGSLAAGEVLVIGTSDIGDYLDATFGVGVIQFHDESFTFNGDDALQIQLDGNVEDTFGVPGSDPGAAWVGVNVETRNSNIALKDGITTGDVDGFTDPDERFVVVSTTPSATGGLEGFGVAPIPEPSAALLGGLGLLTLLRRRR
ncbi:lamin tail domain-containing protein [Roseibacillus persicicus]|uniref:lamin tail domain-containing protein n=1 Tax=Roseibacillus persicicus TaxID=454148 RepID=UPI00398AD2E2